MTERGKRLKIFIKSTGKKSKEIAEELGVTPNYLSILLKKEKFPESFIFRISNVFPELNIKWLEEEQGNMKINAITIDNSINEEEKPSEEDVRKIIRAVYSQESYLLTYPMFEQYIRGIKAKGVNEYLKNKIQKSNLS